MQDNRTEGDRRNWIPAPFQQAAQKIAADAVKQFLTEEVRVVGLGSGPMAAGNYPRNFKITLQRKSSMRDDIYAN